MGDFSEHVLFGFLVATLLYYALGEFLVVEPFTMVAATAAVFIGSVLPDIDHKKSYVHRSAKAFTSISAGLAVLALAPLTYTQRFGFSVAAVLLVYASTSSVKLRHRGLTHSASFCLALTAVVAVLGVVFSGSAVPGLALGTGMLSHLLLDREFKL
ncbi:MAG: metal-dependent hydrolase [Candidatus Nanohaloarchaea archaeon]